MAIVGIESWLIDSEISIIRQHCRERTESEISSELYTINKWKKDYPIPNMVGTTTNIDWTLCALTFLSPNFKTLSYLESANYAL